MSPHATVIHVGRVDYSVPILRAVLRDSRLSFAAWGGFCFIWDLPDNWHIRLIVIDIYLLAAMLLLAAQAIRKHRAGVRICAALDGLPEPFQKRPKLLWWISDIEAWAESRRTFRPSNTLLETTLTQNQTIPLLPKKRSPGRPPNSAKYGARS